MASTDAAAPASSVFFDVESRGIARVYAEALLNAAEKRGETDAVLDELSSFIDEVLAGHPELETFLTSPAVGRDRKAEILEKALAGKTSDLFLDFLQVLNRHERMGLLRPLQVECVEVLRERRKQRRVVVKTVLPLPDDQRDRLLQELRATMQFEPILDLRQDPDILGGMVIQAGDWLYDASVRTRLNQIRNQLFERSSHEIQTRRDRFSSAE